MTSAPTLAYSQLNPKRDELFALTDSFYIDYQDILNTDSLNGRIEKLLVSLGLENIIVPHPDEIRDYLLEYPDIMNVIEKIAPLVSSNFALNAQISLEVYHDPEFIDSYLTIYIRQNTYKDDIIDRIDRFNEGIVRNLTENMTGWLSVTTDFNFPKY